MAFSVTPVTDTELMKACFCDACLEVLSTPPTDYEDPDDALYEQAYEACWPDMGADWRDYE